MPRLSLHTRLIVTFIAITVLCFGAAGAILFNGLSSRIHAQDDLSIVLTTRHLRRLAADIDSVPDVRLHGYRLISLVLGDPSIAMEVLDADGRELIGYDPSGLHIARPQAIPVNQRILPDNIRTLAYIGAAPVRGVAAEAALGDGSRVMIVMARSMADRAALLSGYRMDIGVTLLLGMAMAALLSLVLIRRALRPLRAMTASAQSITAQRLDSRMEAERTPVELQRLAVSLNAMLERLEQGFERVWQFTVDLAHDLRTPVSNLRGANEVALSRPRSVAEYEALLGSNIEECDRVSRTIESVLFLARAENPQFAMQRVLFDTNEELSRIAEYFEGLSAEAGIVVEIHAHAFVRADRELFRRAVSNLLANALRYTPRGGVIELNSMENEDNIVVSVENPGPGIDPMHMARLFERFYRVDRSRSDSATSAGLGLSIVKSIMDLHGGHASVTSVSNGITCFVLTFPK